MTAKWKEVSAYTGQDIDEDVPTNFAGQGSGVDMNPTGMRKKKKRSLLDARTKAYKEHKARLEAKRMKRENAKKSKFVEKVQESIGEFNRESFLVEDNLDVLRDIVKRKQTFIVNTVIHFDLMLYCYHSHHYHRHRHHHHPRLPMIMGANPLLFSDYQHCILISLSCT